MAQYFFWSYPLTNFQFQMIAGSSLFFPMINMKYVVFMSLWPRTIKILFQTDLGHKNSASFLKIQVRKTFSYHGHAMVTLYVQFLCSDWSKFDGWVHAENLCNILKLVYFDSLHWSLQSFVSTCDVFNCLLLWITKWNTAAIKSLLLFICLLGFWLRNASLVNIR